MSKIKVLVLPSDRTGVGKFRSVDPHIFLQNLYPDDFHIDIVFDLDINNPSVWNDYQIVHFHRVIAGNYENTANIVKYLKQKGIKIKFSKVSHSDVIANFEKYDINHVLLFMQKTDILMTLDSMIHKAESNSVDSSVYKY